MGSVEIPKWIGPVVTPVLLILLVIILCAYYCYWKPRKERKKQDSALNIEGNTKKTIPWSPSKRPCEVRYMDDACCYYDSVAPVTTYGQFYPDICPIPLNSALSYCIPREYQTPKIFYYPKYPSQRPCRRECQGLAKIKKCRVKIKGECIKCPDLPVIMEGESTVEEEEDTNPKHLGKESTGCNSVDCSDDNGMTKAVIECENVSEESDGSNDPNVGHDSGYEDQ